MKRLSPTQVKIMENIYDDKDPFFGCYGRSQHGGWIQSLFSLVRKDLVHFSGRSLTIKGELEAKHLFKKPTKSPKTP